MPLEIDEEQYAKLDNIQTLLSQIHGQILGLSSNEALILAKQYMVNATVSIDEVLNARCPLFSLPTELLQRVIAFIPDVMVPRVSRSTPIQAVWPINLRDTAMLIPISQVCRRLRDVTLRCPSLWTSVADLPCAMSRMLAERSQSLPMNVFLPISQTRDYDFANIAEDLPLRVQELHVGYLPSRWVDNETEIIIHRMLSSPLPMLESLSVHFSDNPLGTNNEYTFKLSITEELVPKLRRLALYTCDLDSYNVLSSLTHLALWNVYTSRLHMKIETILSSCHALESLHLDNLFDMDTLRGSIDPRYSANLSGLPSCRRLRRVSLRHLDSHLVSFVSSLVSTGQPLCLQVLESQFQGDRFGPRISSNYPPIKPHGISRVAFGRYPQTHNLHSEYPTAWGLSACGSHQTLRVLGSSLGEVADALLQDKTRPLADIRELWLADVAALTPIVGGETKLNDLEVAALKAVAGMPRLGTVVLANRFQALWSRGRPSLFLLPDARGAVARPSITTLRIVYGYGPFLGHHQWARSAGLPPLDLALVLDELASGAYGYLEHLVIEIPGHVSVDEEDVARLRAYFQTVRVRVVEEAPEMALPEYCVEPAAGPRDANSPWPYNVW